MTKGLRELPLKLKLILGLLIFSAVFLVYRVGSSLVPDSTSAVIKSSTRQTASMGSAFSKDDRDHDGLSDVLESRYNPDPFLADTDEDGFLDGEEMVSGCDPLTKAPGDCLNGQNATKNSARLLIGGMQAGGSLTLSDQSLDIATDSVLEAINAKFTPPVVGTTRATIVSNDAESIPLYLASMRKALSGSILMPREELSKQMSDALTQTFSSPPGFGKARENLSKSFMMK